ncbi:UDP-N-acetylmuramoyl-L-alanine--D-glutamate ligase [Eubacteriales bacterium OttesenSCG-928-G02]|nr:UDP-N-acetylmuramoyl-L-alanine--D-glutamate ligase [Eubacteriales bacterium OttesenSCG-928-G02]
MPESIINYYKNKNIGFIGVGVSNTPIIKLFAENNISVTVRDKNEIETKLDNVSYVLGEDYLRNIKEDVLFLSPAVRPDLPELTEAKNDGVIITNEMEEFFRHCKCKTIAVTGSDGKTTTTTLIAMLLEKSGKKVFLGGNIGANLFCELDNITNDDYVVCELSSFQLMKMTHSPNIAIITNISPNHLDWHIDFNEYKEAKKNILAFQNKNDVCIINADDKFSDEFIKSAKGKIYYTSGNKKIQNGVYFDENAIYAFGKKIIDSKDILLVGVHNKYNYCQAIAATYNYVNCKDILAVASSFGGVKHRCQFIRTFKEVKYYNSSMDSSPTRTIAALNSFNQKVILIAGGYDKKIPLEPLIPVLEDKTKAVFLMGSTADKLELLMRENNYSGSIHRVSSMQEAVNKTTSFAEKGDIILLSPAAASFDMFKNFDERGQIFIDLVNGLE